ncbi:MAG: ATP-dependent DNA helicase RecG [Candidatus Harrisonbacteria bacterium CG10_big_fil_rev_8_21_14_0_10_49_15]|uniref:Probable DNA 3'-5' helicase RecG n=1 Tax=Candidatus Harrisonbacteria bacterium CG10_big_fil_rev_8_21_14_0_10_49_15 TaxID=1974587 RepID=A0A2H0UJZ0_9BACT|nr:MAG: ATP-dependent DNA helicase RecG [Candidatus Harrisonbacteria bacterium CG10_big_fil_rev_8_21_14_0_10_49_15]
MSQNLVTLETRLENIQGIMPKFLPKLKKLGIETVHDLLWHFPTRYEDYSTISKIDQLKPGDTVTIRGEVNRVSTRRAWNRRMYITEVLVVDETGGINLVWFNQPFISKALQEGTRANFAGKVFENKTGKHMANPTFEVLRGTAQTTHTAGLVAVYPETRGLTSKGLRQYIKTFLDILKDIEDFLPEAVLKKNDLPELSAALRQIHFPSSKAQAQRAQARFAFEYVFLLQLNNLKLRADLAKEKAPKLAVSDANLKKLLAMLPFTLTDSQQQSLKEILADISRPHPMNRLLQGDVGSGKTAVAALAAVVAAANDRQAVFMAPTEVLARQHYHTLTKMFKKFDGGAALITGSEARVYYEKGLEEKKTKAALIKLIESGAIKTIIGTHSLIASGKDPVKSHSDHGASKKGGVHFPDPGIVIVDEQHRFGVRQRAALSDKKTADLLPHFLSMSATPIPRTLALAVFGDLDVSTINELPKGRKEIITKIVDPENRPKAYGFVKQHIKAGRQVFIIYPRIEQAEVTEDESGSVKKNVAWSESKAVKAEHERLSTKVFPDLRVGMLHGKLKAVDKKKVMEDFKRGVIDVLVSTSVVEVGVDVPNATIMVIEGAQHFGLAQLYQFRGRVGRGEHQSFCFLFTDSHSETTHKRLQALIDAKNGFELAEKDLELRGPGQFLGDKQTGLPDLAMNSLNDIRLVKSARDSASALLKKDPELATHPKLAEKLDNLSQQVHLE